VALMWNRSVEWDTDDWREVSACRNTEPDLFFPVGTTGPAIEQIEAAKRVCRSLRRHRALPGIRTDDKPGVRRLGRHLRGGAAASSVRPGSPLVGVPPPERALASTLSPRTPGGSHLPAPLHQP